jgi:AraC-like DNA-binding protein
MTKAILRAQLAYTTDSVRIIYTAGPLARQSLSYIQEVGYFKSLPGYYTERAGVASYLLVYTLHGQGILSYGGQEYTVSPGQVFFIDCRQRQYYAQTGTEPWEIYWVHFNGNGCSAYWKAICQTADGQPGEPLAWAEQAAFVDPIRLLLQLCTKPGLQTDILASQQVVSLLTTVLLAAGRLEPRARDHSPAVQAVLDRLQQQPAEAISLADLAATVSLNKQYLLRLFQRETGLTPLGYQQALRISQAKKLLRTTDLTVQMVAEKVGLDNGNYFIRLFKRLEGLTPLAYRKKWNTSSETATPSG